MNQRGEVCQEAATQIRPKPVAIALGDAEVRSTVCVAEVRGLSWTTVPSGLESQIQFDIAATQVGRTGRAIDPISPTLLMCQTAFPP